MRSGVQWLVMLAVTLASCTEATSDGPTSPSSPSSLEVAPEVSIAADCTGLTCEFEGRSANGWEATARWHWEFGDGSTTSFANPSHTFEEPGEYTVTALVTGPAGFEASAERIATVRSPTETPVELTCEIVEYGAGRYQTRWDHGDPGFAFTIDDTWWITDYSPAEDYGGDWDRRSAGLGFFVAMTPDHPPYPRYLPRLDPPGPSC